MFNIPSEEAVTFKKKLVIALNCVKDAYQHKEAQNVMFIRLKVKHGRYSSRALKIFPPIENHCFSKLLHRIEQGIERKAVEVVLDEKKSWSVRQ